MSDQDPFQGLYEKLNAQKGWPMVYLFKFIIPNDNRKLAMTEQLFGPEAQVNINKSRTGKYLSISAKEIMINPSEVIERYRNASKIEGLISL